MGVIFVHIPKTAGTSLRTALEQSIGAAAIHYDYGVDAAMLAPWQAYALRLVSRLMLGTKNQMVWTKLFAHLWAMRTHIIPRQYVYGHFVVAKYLSRRGDRWNKLPGFQYVTFVREPLQRAVSQYYYLLESDAPHDPVVARLQRDAVSLAEFLVDPFFANMQSRYLYGLPVHAFDVVGVVEEMELSVALLERVIPACGRLLLTHENKTVAKPLHEIEQTLTPQLISMFYALNTQDVVLYRTALTILQKRSTHEQICEF